MSNFPASFILNDIPNIWGKKLCSISKKASMTSYILFRKLYNFFNTAWSQSRSLKYCPCTGSGSSKKDRLRTTMDYCMYYNLMITRGHYYDKGFKLYIVDLKMQFCIQMLGACSQWAQWSRIRILLVYFMDLSMRKRVKLLLYPYLFHMGFLWDLNAYFIRMTCICRFMLN